MATLEVRLGVDSWGVGVLEDGWKDGKAGFGEKGRGWGWAEREGKGEARGCLLSFGS